MSKLFKAKRPHYEYLRKKWVARHRALQNKLFDKHPTIGRHLAVGALGGLILLTTPAIGLLPAPHLLAQNSEIIKEEDQNRLLAAKLEGKLPEEIRPLTAEEEEEIATILSKNFGFEVVAAIDGIRLNRSFGVIGGEQHLYRFPGDILFKHLDNATEWAMYGPAGIAPSLGAWGYFAPSEKEFGEINKLREKYYLAVQTFLSPGFAENVKKFRDFFKFRKMLVVNPETGQAVVAIVADAGPATWTGKHLGGSPEVMHHLGLSTGPRSGTVLYFFIDDSQDQVPLGPIKVVEQ